MVPHRTAAVKKVLFPGQLRCVSKNRLVLEGPVTEREG